MLRIYFGDLEEAIFNTNVYFDNTYEDKWITSDFARAIIKDIDKSEVIGSHCIESPVLGAIPPTQLAGGTKTLLLMYFEPETIFNASTCGDNCAKWILQIAREKDITINLRHFMNFGFKGSIGQDIIVLNNNVNVHDANEFIDIAVKYLGEME